MFSAENAKKKWDSQEYLAKKNVRDLMETLVSELVLFKPNSPIDYLLGRVDQLSKGTKAPTHPNAVMVVGTPYSGKGTQCALLVEKFGAVHLHGGDILRNEIRKGSKEGQLIDKALKSKKPVPTDIYLSLLQAQTQGKPSSTVCAIDDFPANLTQALAYEKQLSEVRFVIFIECSETTVQRRRAQKQHEENYDITEEMMHERFKDFQANLLPVIEYFDAVGKLRRVDGSGSVAEVWKQVEQAFLPTLLL